MQIKHTKNIPANLPFQTFQILSLDEMLNFGYLMHIQIIRSCNEFAQVPQLLFQWTLADLATVRWGPLFHRTTAILPVVISNYILNYLKDECQTMGWPRASILVT